MDYGHHDLLVLKAHISNSNTCSVCHVRRLGFSQLQQWCDNIHWAEVAASRTLHNKEYSASGTMHMKNILHLVLCTWRQIHTAPTVLPGRLICFWPFFHSFEAHPHHWWEEPEVECTFSGVKLKVMTYDPASQSLCVPGFTWIYFLACISQRICQTCSWSMGRFSSAFHNDFREMFSMRMFERTHILHGCI
jgi:hypothetical protein